MKYLDLADYVRPEAAGAPDFLLERVIRESVIDFCIKTDAYRLEPETLQIVAGIDEYDVSIPTGTELNNIIDIYRNHVKLTPVSYSRLLELQGDGTSKSKPRYFSQRDNTVFYVAPVPNEKESLKVLYSVKPNSTSTSIPDTIGKEYREAIVHGAVYRLQMMADSPWTNLPDAQANKSLFDRSSGQIRRKVQYGYSGGSLTVKYRGLI